MNFLLFLEQAVSFFFLLLDSFDEIGGILLLFPVVVLDPVHRYWLAAWNGWSAALIKQLLLELLGVLNQLLRVLNVALKLVSLVHNLLSILIVRQV